MFRASKIVAAAALTSILAACGGGGGQQSTLPAAGSPQSVGQAASVADMNQWRPIFTTLPPRGVNFAALDTQAGASATIPFYKSTVVSPLDKRTYTYSIVGANPSTSKVATNVSYVPIVLRVHFADGTVLDPTLPGCNDTVSVSDRFYKGPNFVNTSLTSNGVHVGTTQITDAMQRAEFWSVVKASPNYHTLLKAAAQPLVIDINAPTGSITQKGVCAGKTHRIGNIDINAYDSIVRSLATAHATPTQVPVVLTYNVFLTSGGCCIIGYHSAFGRSTGTQVYAVGTYNDPGIFGTTPIEDIHAWTHELGELFNDPFVNNATPAWGHVGQVSGCQNNLEVGDPLTGTAITVSLNGFTYHPQELVFFSWFFRTPASGTGGEFSFNGTFETAQGACH